MCPDKKTNNEKSIFIGSSVVLWQILFFYIPIFIIFLTSLKSGFVKSGFANYYKIFSFDYFYIIFKSLGLAFLNSTFCFLIGYPIAYFITFHAKKFKNFFLFLVIVPFWTNFLLHIYSWFFVLEQYGFLNTLLLKLSLISEPLKLLNSFFAIILVLVYCYLPFMILPIYSALERFDKRLIEASLDLGATNIQTLFKVILPMSISGIISGIFLVFVPTFGEFAIISSLGGDRYIFVGNVISDYVLGVATQSVGSAFTVVSTLIVFFVAGIIYCVFRKYIK